MQPGVWVCSAAYCLSQYLAASHAQRALFSLSHSHRGSRRGHWASRHSHWPLRAAAATPRRALSCSRRESADPLDGVSVVLWRGAGHARDEGACGARRGRVGDRRVSKGAAGSRRKAPMAHARASASVASSSCRTPGEAGSSGRRERMSEARKESPAPIVSRASTAAAKPLCCDHSPSPSPPATHSAAPFAPRVTQTAAAPVAVASCAAEARSAASSPTAPASRPCGEGGRVCGGRGVESGHAAGRDAARGMLRGVGGGSRAPACGRAPAARRR